MAVIEHVPGIEVTVHTKDGALKEYGDEVGSRDGSFKGGEIPLDRLSSKHIECISDAEFYVKCTIKPDVYHEKLYNIKFGLIIDGISICGKTICSSNLGKSNKSRTENLTHYRIATSENQYKNRTLKFRQLDRVEDFDKNRIEADSKLVPGLGEIVVSVHRTKRSVAPTLFAEAKQPKSTVTELAEKALKGKTLSHCISFGAETTHIRRPRGSTTTFIDGRKNPIALFRFKYRSRGKTNIMSIARLLIQTANQLQPEALQSECIIPQTPSPEPESNISGDAILANNADNANGANGASERINALQREIDKIKQEEADKIKQEEIAKIKKEETENQPRMSRKRQRSEFESSFIDGHGYKTSRNTDGVMVVDLTDD